MNDELRRIDEAVGRAMTVLVTLFGMRLSPEAPESSLKTLYARVSALWVKLAGEKIFGEQNRRLTAQLADSPLAYLIPPELLPPPPLDDKVIAEARTLLADCRGAIIQEYQEASQSPVTIEQLIRILSTAGPVAAFARWPARAWTRGRSWPGLAAADYPR